MKEHYILTPREREFIEDWLKVVEGEIDKIEFFRKWSTKKDDRTFLDDYERVKAGEMSLEEFREKWTKKGAWKDYVTVMKHRLRKKYRNRKKIIEKIQEEFTLLARFLSLEELP